jgi:hypothetical protein
LLSFPGNQTESKHGKKEKKSSFENKSQTFWKIKKGQNIYMCVYIYIYIYNFLFCCCGCYFSRSNPSFASGRRKAKVKKVMMVVGPNRNPNSLSPKALSPIVPHRNRMRTRQLKSHLPKTIFNTLIYTLFHFSKLTILNSFFVSFKKKKKNSFFV